MLNLLILRLRKSHYTLWPLPFPGTFLRNHLRTDNWLYNSKQSSGISLGFLSCKNFSWMLRKSCNNNSECSTTTGANTFYIVHAGSFLVRTCVSLVFLMLLLSTVVNKVQFSRALICIWSHFSLSCKLYYFLLFLSFSPNLFIRWTIRYFNCYPPGATVVLINVIYSWWFISPLEAKDPAINIFQGFYFHNSKRANK